jgi:hypothetical protein
MSLSDGEIVTQHVKLTVLLDLNARLVSNQGTLGLTFGQEGEGRQILRQGTAFVQFCEHAAVSGQ